MREDSRMFWNITEHMEYRRKRRRITAGIILLLASAAATLAFFIHTRFMRTEPVAARWAITCGPDGQCSILSPPAGSTYTSCAPLWDQCAGSSRRFWSDGTIQLDL